MIRRDAEITSARPFSWIVASVLAVMVWVTGCGSRPTAEDTPVDEELERFSLAATKAFRRGKYGLAAGAYRRALERAYTRDDLAAIVDNQYNLSLTLLRMDAPADARAALDRAKAELARAQRRPSKEMLLLEATILYRMGQYSAAADICERVLADSSSRPDVVARTWFVRGLVAAEQGETARLETAAAALAVAGPPQIRADRSELDGRLDLARLRWDDAIGAFEVSAALRRAHLDYPGMARALALAGEASERSGRPATAAAYYLRAGRSAARLARREQALIWLGRADQLAERGGDSATAQAARRQLELLERGEGG